MNGRYKSATAAQITEATREFSQRRKACLRLGVEPPTFNEIIADIMNSPPGSMETRAMTPEERRFGTSFQSYTQYLTPTNLKET